MEVPEVPEVPNEKQLGAGDLTKEPTDVAFLSLRLLPLVTAFTLFPFWMRWGGGALMHGHVVLLNPWALLAGLIVLAPLHEGLHALGYLVGGVPRRALRFGVDLRTCSLLTYCAAPVNIEVFRFASVLPFMLLGLVPTLLSWGTGSGWLALAAMCSTASATGDLLLLWRIRGVPADRWVADHPVRIGCHVLPRDFLPGRRPRR